MYDDKLIIVGNGLSLIDRKMGKTIDSFKDVVRINNYVIEGYEEHVGSKTTIWCRNNSNRTQERDCSQFDQVIIASPARDYASEANYHSSIILQERIENSIVIDEDIKNELQREIGLSGSARIEPEKRKRIRIRDKMGRRMKRRNNGWPSTGLMIVHYLIKTKPNPIYIIGFDNFQKIRGYPRHYYNNKEAMPTSVMHSAEKEKDWIKEQRRQGRIRIL
jgi:hypothetical protein